MTHHINLLNMSTGTTNLKNKVLPDDSVARIEKHMDDFDNNIKIVNFYLETETLYTLEFASKNLKKITNLLAECSRIVFIIL